MNRHVIEDHGGGGVGAAGDRLWSWWAREGRARWLTFDAAADGGLVAETAEAVRAVDPGLVFEVGPGVRTERCFTISGEADPRLREITSHLIAAAPADDRDWEYAPARRARPHGADDQFHWAGRTWDLTRTVFDIFDDPERTMLNVGVWHPDYPTLDEHARHLAAWLTLDQLLGEDDVVRWIGAVQVDSRAAHGVVGDGLISAVNRLRVETAAHPSDRYTMLEGTTPTGQPITVTARRPLRWIDHPRLTTAVTLTRRYPARPDGTPAAADSLDAIFADEDALSDVLAQHSQRDSAVVAAYLTTDGHRTIIIYTDPTTPGPLDAIAGWASATGSSITIDSDPGWTSVASFA